MAEHPDPDLVLDLALGHLTGPVRDAAASHLSGCPACRADFEELSAAVESTLAAVPRTEPRPGFAASVLDRLEPPRSERTRTRADDPARARVPTWVGIAAAAVLGLGVGSGITLAAGDGFATAPTTQVPAAAEQPPPTTGAALLTTDGTTVGTVSRSFGESGPMLVVDITGGESGRNYLCRLQLADGATQDVGRWTLSPDRPNSWVVADPGADAVELISDAGNVWSSATL